MKTANQNQNNTTYLITEQQLPSYPAAQPVYPQQAYPVAQPAFYAPQPQPVYNLPAMNQFAYPQQQQPYGQPYQ